jgi:hypothetical protein
MAFPTKLPGWAGAGLVLAGVIALAVGGETRAGAGPDVDPPPPPAALARQIDRAILEQLAQHQATPAPPADDAEFLRRAYLDITGVIPPADKVTAFLESTRPDKRARLIDELLASPNYGRHMADLWKEQLLAQQDLLTRSLPVDPLATWLTDRFNSNMPWDRLVAELLTSTGTQEQNGAVTFFLAHRSPDRVTDTVCRVFLGIQLQCAQCHNHPYTGWQRAEYWGMAAFFAKVDDAAPKKLTKASEPPHVFEAAAVQKKRLPDSALDTPPKFLEGGAAKLASKDPYRPALAAWLTAADNPYFAKAMVNRTWAQFFGRGLVNPVDNLMRDNPASHPELFDALAGEFVRTGFDVKHLVRAICASEAYQRSSTPPAAGPTAVPYAAMALKPLTPEQRYDSLAAVLGESTDPIKGQGKKYKGARPSHRTAFVDYFRPAEGADPNDYPAGIPQVLRLMNANWMAQAPAAARKTVKPNEPPARNIERLFLATLSRRPTAAELARLEGYVRDNKAEPTKAYADILWALLNSGEFALNH